LKVIVRDGTNDLAIVTTGQTIRLNVLVTDRISGLDILIDCTRLLRRGCRRRLGASLKAGMGAPVLFEQFSARHRKYKITPRGDTNWHTAPGSYVWGFSCPRLLG
jgi:hypothetical protein